jgi:hypothetical protein
MKTLSQIVESAISTVSGGLYIDDRNIYNEQIEQKVHEARAMWCAQNYKLNRSIHETWIQRFYLELDPDAQDNECLTRFNMPSVIWLDDKTDGLRYFGSDNYADNFTRIWNRAMLSSMMKHPATRIGRRNYVLLQGENSECYTVAGINPPIVEGVFSDPTDVPSFNKNKHMYPIDPMGIDYIEKYLVSTVLKTIISTPADIRSDGVDTTKLPNPRQ